MSSPSQWPSEPPRGNREGIENPTGAAQALSREDLAGHDESDCGNPGQKPANTASPTLWAGENPGVFRRRVPTQHSGNLRSGGVGQSHLADTDGGDRLVPDVHLSHELAGCLICPDVSPGARHLPTLQVPPQSGTKRTAWSPEHLHGVLARRFHRSHGRETPPRSLNLPAQRGDLTLAEPGRRWSVRDGAVPRRLGPQRPTTQGGGRRPHYRCGPGSQEEGRRSRRRTEPGR
jgi:hypothetical protein